MDRILVERAQRGDREAFAQLTLATSNRLYAIAFRMLRDSDAAGDALQSAIVRIWHGLPSLRDAERFEAWSYQVLVRQCHSELRRRSRRQATNVSLSSNDTPVADSQLGTAMRDELDRAFGRLSADQRSVVVLMYYRDMSVADIAATLGVSVGTVKSRLHYARRALRAAIEADARPVPQEGAQHDQPG